MHIPTRFFTFIVLTLGPAAFFAPPARAAVPLPWSATYNCQDWKQSDGLPSCDGLTDYGGWSCDNGDGTVREEQITIGANYPGGLGGKGQRHWKGDGINNNSGSMMIAFSSSQSELWIRWYMRYEQGFEWNTLNHDKILYIDVGAPWWVVVGYMWSDEIQLTVYGAYGATGGPGSGWNTTMANGAADARGNKRSDGQWHLYEVHIKMDTNGSNGIGEVWIDGINRISSSNINFGGSTGKTGWSHIAIGENNRNPSNSRCMYVDFDDLAIRTTGPIGSVGPGDTLAPAAPSNLTVQ